MTQQEAARVLKDAGCAVTRPRREILERVSRHDQPFSPTEIIAEAPRIGRATIFRTLDLLQRVGILQRISGQSAAHPQYIFCDAEHHHHLTCLACGRVVHVSGCAVEQFEKELAQATGFIVKGHSLEFTGTCPRCREQSGEKEHAG